MLAYGALWLASHQVDESSSGDAETGRLSPSEVVLILAVPSINKALRDELEALELAIPSAVDGYHRFEATLPRLLVADLSVIAEREDDDILRWFSGRRVRTLEAQRWVRHHQGTRSDTMTTNATPDHEGYDEWVARYAETLTPEQRLAVASRFTEVEHVLAMPDHLLRMLPTSYLDSLPPDARDAGRRRLGR